MKLQLRRWHSINPILFLSAMTVVADEKPYHDFARSFDLVWLGWILNLEIKRDRKMWVTPVIGPLYSRRRKRWYLVDSYGR